MTSILRVSVVLGWSLRLTELLAFYLIWTLPILLIILISGDASYADLGREGGRRVRGIDEFNV